MSAKAILPRFGGSAGVWVTCMLFFQAALLLGYLYAYLITRYVPRRVQPWIHLALLLVSLTVLPLKPATQWKPSAGENPAWSILAVLSSTAGLPYFALSTASPLMQFWFAGLPGAALPYRFFALSNAASLAALFAYPTAIEPLLSVSAQMRWWSAAYLAIVLLASAATLLLAGSPPPADRESAVPQAHDPVNWLALSACASTLWLAVANHLSHQVAAIPFLWVLALGVYLLSFVLCFEGDGWYRPTVFRWLLPVAWLAIGSRIGIGGTPIGLRWEIPMLFGALLVCCMFCHGELAATRPDSRQGLAFYYLTIACGGVLGALFVGTVAPAIFSTYLELPIGVTACILLALAALYGFPAKRLIRLGAVAVLAFVAALRLRPGGQDVVRLRNFYGALQVSDSGQGDDAVRTLYDGRTLHGAEFLAPARSRIATAYYGADSGAGVVLSAAAVNRRVAIVGLGAGTLAVYGRPGDQYRFYEINPAVIQVASQQFRFLAGSQAAVQVLLSDGRLALQRDPPKSFDVIVLDAFADDSIPVHLLTREAFELYFERLRDGGTLAIHLTNRYLDLTSVVKTLAAEAHRHCLLVSNSADPARQISASDWAILTGPQPSPPPLTTARVWTDDYSNLFTILK